MDNNKIIEQKLDELNNNLSSELKTIQIKLTHLETINSTHESRSKKNEIEIEELKAKMYKAEGTINLGKWLCAFFIGYMISFGIWVNTNIHNLQGLNDDIHDVERGLHNLEQRILKVDEKVLK